MCMYGSNQHLDVRYTVVNVNVMLNYYLIVTDSSNNFCLTYFRRLNNVTSTLHFTIFMTSHISF